ncbi:MAG TPA: hydrogenase maturation nickel metallochaperone HypA [Vicinamibacteria bacterium]|nr:hydrogenase maturation nickel metallochaperone HypA [Vicinamibacteria bacterium]
MHEYSIVQALLARVGEEARRHGATAVRRVRISIGELAGVEIELLRTAYETFRERTPCAQAPLEVNRIEARWECSDCGRALERGGLLRCPECAKPGRLARGDEIVLDQLELEVA